MDEKALIERYTQIVTSHGFVGSLFNLTFDIRDMKVSAGGTMTHPVMDGLRFRVWGDGGSVEEAFKRLEELATQRAEECSEAMATLKTVEELIVAHGFFKLVSTAKIEHEGSKWVLGVNVHPGEGRPIICLVGRAEKLSSFPRQFEGNLPLWAKKYLAEESTLPT